MSKLDSQTVLPPVRLHDRPHMCSSLRYIRGLIDSNIKYLVAEAQRRLFHPYSVATAVGASYSSHTCIACTRGTLLVVKRHERRCTVTRLVDYSADSQSSAVPAEVEPLLDPPSIRETRVWRISAWCADLDDRLAVRAQACADGCELGQHARIVSLQQCPHCLREVSSP